VVLVNAQHVKAVPGRKTDVRDAEWLAQLVEHGLLRPSFIPPLRIRELRELTRYRLTLKRTRADETNRVQKLLEGANIKLGNVATDVLGASGRAMCRALIAGETEPTRLAELAKGALRRKRPALIAALRGRFTPHHAVLLQMLLDHIDDLTRHNVNNHAPPNFGVDGEYTCYPLGPDLPLPVPVLSSGTLNLGPSLRNGSGLVDATRGWLVGAKGDYPFQVT
jgi:hypothetical protein